MSMLETFVEVGKGLSILLQAGFGIFGLTHEFKNAGQLTRPGKIAIAGISLSAFFGMAIYIGEIYLKNLEEQKALRAIYEQQHKQTELLQRQTDTLNLTQRLMLPLEQVRLSLRVAVSSKNKVATEFCDEKFRQHPDDPIRVISFPMADAENSANSLHEVTSPMGHLLIGSREAVTTAVGTIGRFVDMPKLDYEALFHYADVDGKSKNRVVQVICYQRLDYPRAVIYLEYDALTLENNRGIFSILDLRGKYVGVRLADYILSEGVQIASFTVHFTSDPENLSLNLNVGGIVTDFRQGAKSPIGPSAPITRYASEKINNSTSFRLCGALGPVNAESMPILRYLSVTTGKPELSCEGQCTSRTNGGVMR